jgi:hypothetical protein
MAETPFEQEELADATNCTVGLTVLPLAGADTETLADARPAEHSAIKRANFFIKYLRSVRYKSGCPYRVSGWIVRILPRSEALLN